MLPSPRLVYMPDDYYEQQLEATRKHNAKIAKLCMALAEYLAVEEPIKPIVPKVDTERQNAFRDNHLNNLIEELEDKKAELQKYEDLKQSAIDKGAPSEMIEVALGAVIGLTESRIKELERHLKQHDTTMSPL